MDAADTAPEPPSGQPSVLGSLPTTRPQHRSERRNGQRDATPTRPKARAAERHSKPPTPTEEPPTHSAASAPAPAPPTAPRSGWATPAPDRSPRDELPPLAALVDGVVRSGEQVVRGVLRRLPFR